MKLYVDSAEQSVLSVRGGNATLQCRFWYEPVPNSPREVRVKWSWLPAAGGQETDVIVAFRTRFRSFGDFRLKIWSTEYDNLIADCLTMFFFKLLTCTVCRAGVVCSSDRISLEMLHLCWINSGWMIQVAIDVLWWMDWRTKAQWFT